MDEKEIFNKDVMYWREVNIMAPDCIAEIKLIDPVNLNGDVVKSIDCFLLPFEAAEMLYELEDGSAFKKNEVQAWPYLNLTDVDFYKDKSNEEGERYKKVNSVAHSNVQAVILKNQKGNVVLNKAKI